MIEQLVAGNQSFVETEYRPNADYYQSIAAIEDGGHENYIADWLCIASGAKVVADRVAAERSRSRKENEQGERD
jgi:hypothetical protein